MGVHELSIATCLVETLLEIAQKQTAREVLPSPSRLKNCN